MPRKEREAEWAVAIVSANAETIEDLQRYFDGVGVHAYGSRTIASIDAVTAKTTVAVFFPDDFDLEAAESWVRALRASKRPVLLLVVTREPHKLRAALEPDGVSTPPIVVARPAFGWALLDTIRAHRASRTAPRGSR